MDEQASIRGERDPTMGAPRIWQLSAPHWAWLTLGAIGVLVAWSLWSNLGSSLTAVRYIEALWLVVVALVAVCRWWIDRDRSAQLLAGALVGLVAATIVLYGGGLPLAAIKVVVGLFWIALRPVTRPGFLQHTTWINDALDRGWVVAAADYAGAAGTGVGEK